MIVNPDLGRINIPRQGRRGVMYGYHGGFNTVGFHRGLYRFQGSPVEEGLLLGDWTRRVG